MARKFLFALCLIGITSLARADVTVVSSVRPLQFIAAAIVGDGDRTISLIGASDSPHSFALTPQDRLAIDQADILLWVSPGFELYLADLFTALEGNKSVITVADLPGLTRQEFEDGSLDPHVWLDPDNAVAIAGTLSARLSEMYPQQADSYQQALQAFTESTDENWMQIEQIISDARRSNYMVYHEAYQYFEAALGISGGGALVHNPELEPGMREVIALREQVAELDPNCIILEPDASLALVDTLVQDPDIARVTIDLLGNNIDVGPAAYPELLMQVARGFQSCFKAGD